MGKGRHEGKGPKGEAKRKKAARKARSHDERTQNDVPKLGKWIRDLTPEQRFLLARADAMLKGRLDRKRYDHSHGVSRTAAKMAKTYGADVWLAGLAGLVHDWNKRLPADELLAQGHAIGFDFPEGHEHDVVSLLHGPTAAVAISHMLPEVPHEALQAVARHTTGAIGMTDLDMIVYVADMIEPGRSFDGVDKLRALVGKAPLPEVYQACYAQSMASLFERGRYVCPAGVEVWNDLVTAREA